ncbi:MAG: hypothetical protein WCD54_21655, partial [Pseudolabrys sp.]
MPSWVYQPPPPPPPPPPPEPPPPEKPDEPDEAGSALAKASLMLATDDDTALLKLLPDQPPRAPPWLIAAHRIAVAGMRAPHGRSKGFRPGLFHIERNRIRQQRLEPIGGYLGRVKVETVRFSRLKIK